jgi:hypothetical protein
MIRVSRQARGKQFFFEKKNQKTFIPLREGLLAGPGATYRSKSFLVLFFKKEQLPCCPYAPKRRTFLYELH